MAGLLERLRELLADTEPPDDRVAALDIAFQQELASLHEVRRELDAVAAARRRLAVAAGLADSVARASAAARDAELAGRESTLERLSDALRAQLDAFRLERDRINSLPDPGQVSRQAHEALMRWQQDARRLLRDAEDGYPEPSGIVADAEPSEGYEQPPGPAGGRR